MPDVPISSNDFIGQYNDVLRRLRAVERLLFIGGDDNALTPLQTFEDGSPLGDTLGINFGAGLDAVSVGDGLVEVTGGGSGGLVSLTYIVAGTTTYTTPTGIGPIYVECIGAGGGGGGGSTAASSAAAGAGGSGGGYAASLLTDPDASYPCAVGTGGAGGTAGNNAGSVGGDTTFGTGPLISAVGGNGGGAMAAGTTPLFSIAPNPGGGATLFGDLAIRASPGHSGIRLSGTMGLSGAGGAAARGGGGHRPQEAAANGFQGFGPGGGGCGGLVLNGSLAASGGAGANGIIIVWEFAS